MSSVAEELSRLAELRDRGVLTEGEFAAEKAKLLAGGTQQVSAPAITPASQPKPAAVAVGCLIVIFATIFLFYMLGALSPSNETAPSTGPAIELTADELHRAYAENEVAAKESYGDGPLIVTGIAERISLNLTDDPVIELATSERFATVHAGIAEADRTAAAGIAKGVPLRLRCDGSSEVIGTPFLQNCRFAQRLTQ